MTGAPNRIVVMDANVLINLLHVARLGLCNSLPGLEFVIPDLVYGEIKEPGQRRSLESAINAGDLEVASITEPGDLSSLAELTTRLGRGEAACLVLAVKHGWLIASDEKGRFRREAVERIGEENLIGTPDLFIRAINSDLITVEEADAAKLELERQRFRMTFRSFRERV